MNLLHHPNFKNVRALVIGDIMLDRYEYGEVKKISPEAPVPIFNPTKEKYALGGVGNVAANLASLGCQVRVIARIGSDTDGKVIEKLAKNISITTNFYHQPGWPTTVKTRLIANNNHLLRIDNEQLTPLSKQIKNSISAAFAKHLHDADVIILSDYAKGMLTASTCHDITIRCAKQHKIVIVDPKGSDYEKYTGAFLIKPNLKELSLATNTVFDTKSPAFFKDVTRAARKLAKKLKITGMLVTLSELGMIYVPTDKRSSPIHLPTQAKEVFDVSGAGDTAIAVLGATLGAGFSIHDAMEISNLASGIVVSKLGTATINFNELISASTIASPRKRKIISTASLTRLSQDLKSQGKRIGFTNGCFDCCHLGHLHSLQEAKALCDILIVGVNSDKWIRINKGENRPIQDQRTRTELLANLECVDYVVVFESKTALPLVRKLQPDIIAKEGYTIENWPEGRFVETHGGKAITLNRIKGYSTSSLAEKMGSNT